MNRNVRWLLGNCVMAGLAGLSLAAEEKRNESGGLIPPPKMAGAQLEAKPDDNRRLTRYLAYPSWACITPRRMTMEPAASAGCTFGGLMAGVEAKDITETGVLNLLSPTPSSSERSVTKIPPETPSPSPTLSPAAAMAKVSPHTTPDILVYANLLALARAAIIEEGGHLPVGSVLVKEKYETRGAAQPQLITVMEKTSDTGTVDDWLFTMVKLPERKIVRERPKVECASCHADYDRTDFVSALSFRLLQQFAKDQASARK